MTRPKNAPAKAAIEDIRICANDMTGIHELKRLLAKSIEELEGFRLFKRSI
jgi:hypothetical protein